MEVARLEQVSYKAPIIDKEQDFNEMFLTFQKEQGFEILNQTPTYIA